MRRKLVEGVPVDEDRPGVFSVAQKLDRLFTTLRARGQSEHSYQAVADAIREHQHVAISHTYIWQLRTGRRDNPTIQHLAALARFFGVPVAYFLDDDEARRIDGQLALLATLRDTGVTEIALRAADLSPGSREAVTQMIRQVWELENGASGARAPAQPTIARTPSGAASRDVPD